jgi:hypothetical protein
MEHLNLLTGGELWHFLQRVEIFPNGEKFYYSPGGARIALTGTCLLPAPLSIMSHAFLPPLWVVSSRQMQVWDREARQDTRRGKTRGKTPDSPHGLEARVGGCNTSHADKTVLLATRVCRHSVAHWVAQI